MTVRLRSIFDGDPTYRPGECPDEEEGDQLLKCHPTSSPGDRRNKLKTSLLSAFESTNRYPDFYKQDLSIELAKYTNMQPDEHFADDGSGTLLQDLVRLVVNDGDEVVFGSPSFAAYDIDVLLAGGVSVKVPLDESWTYDLEGVEHAITDKTRMVLLATE